MNNLKITIKVWPGALIACICSYVTWHSIAWAIVNGLCSWFYVIYWLIRWGDW